MEVWKSVPGHENRYLVSSEGRVRSVGHVGKGRRPTGPDGLLSLIRNEAGYFSVNVYEGLGVRRRWRVHQLVLLAFVGPCPPGCIVHHVNGNRADNRLENLTYASYSYNARTACHVCPACGHRFTISPPHNP